MLRQGRGGREALDNVEKGARKFVNQVDYENDSKGGLMLYADTIQIRVPLGGGEQNRKNMLQALGKISIKPTGNSNAAGAAIRDATGLLPTQENDPDATNVLIIIDAGAPEVPGPGPPIINRPTACNAARQSGVLVVGIGFPEARGRLLSCVTRGWYFSVDSQTGRNVPELFGDITEAILRGREINQVDYSDWPYPGIDYVDGSGYPRDYDFETIGEYTWEFPGKDAPPTGQKIEYSLELDKVSWPGNQIGTISNDSMMSFNYTAGDSIDVEMPNPDICVYRPGEALFCEDWARQNLTPTAPAVTPTVTDTPEPVTATATDAPATDTPTPTEEGPDPTETPTPTADVHGYDIFMPMAYNGSG
jgi:hypothetical protein